MMEVVTVRVVGAWFWAFAGILTIVALWLAHRAGWARFAVRLWAVGALLNVAWEVVMVSAGWRVLGHPAQIAYQGVTEWGTFIIVLILILQQLEVVSDVGPNPS